MDIPDKTKIKIQEKIYGMAYLRSLENQHPKITIPEFKFIISRYHMKIDWFSLAKELEKQGILKLHGTNPIEIVYKKQLLEKIRDNLSL